VRKTVLFAGKAAPGYFNAKCIIRLICGISEVVNADPETNHYLKVFFVPNYNVTLAEKMIPASDLSQVGAHLHFVSHVTRHTSHVTRHTSHVTHHQHISTAGMEASGTSNMKFIMNGGIIIGTLDGANVEISEQVQRDNVFIFGLRTEQIDTARHSMK
jgi:starch phosphorylase